MSGDELTKRTRQSKVSLKKINGTFMGIIKTKLFFDFQKADCFTFYFFLMTQGS